MKNLRYHGNQSISLCRQYYQDYNGLMLTSKIFPLRSIGFAAFYLISYLQDHLRPITGALAGALAGACIHVKSYLKMGQNANKCLFPDTLYVFKVNLSGYYLLWYRE